MRLTKEEANKYCAQTGEKRKRTPPRQDSTRQKLFLAMCHSHGLPEPVAEYKFHPDRKWRFDWLFEGYIAVEIVGGVWTRGHHSRGKDQMQDMEKRNEAQIMGYMVLEFTPSQIDNGSAFPIIRRALEETK